MTGLAHGPEVWLTAREIAEQCGGASGVPKTRQGVEVLIKRAGLQGRPRRGRGGGVEYAAADLPLAMRGAIRGAMRGAQKEEFSIGLAAPTLTGAVVTRVAANVPGADRRDARLQILTLVELWRVQRGVSLTAARKEFAALWNDGRAELYMTVPPWVRGAVSGELSLSTLRRWSRLRERGEIRDLAGRYGRSKKSPIDRLGLGEMIVGLKIERPHLTAAHVHEQLVARVGWTVVDEETGEACPLPSGRAISRWWKSWLAANKKNWLLVTSPDDYKSKYAPAFGCNDEWLSAPNQIWEIDASPADILLQDGRYSIYACVDLYTRRARVLVTKTPRTDAALLLIKMCIEEWGVPAVLKTDNGSDFVSRTARLALDCLGIAHKIAPPFTPEAKGHVERFIRTLQHGLMPLLSGYIGHNVADRKQIEARKSFAQRLGEKAQGVDVADMSRAAFQEQCNLWASQKYEHQAHSQTGATPAQMALEYTGAIRRIDDAALLALFLQPVRGDRLCTVQKRGIRINNGYYIADWLEVGAHVFARQDPHDQGRVYLFEPDLTTYLGVAVDPELVGASRAGIAKAMKDKAVKQDKDARAMLKAVRKKAMGRESLIEAARKVWSEELPNVVRLGTEPQVEHITDKMKAGQAALEVEVAAAPSATELAARAHVEREMQAEAMDCAKLIELETDEQKYRRWQRLNRRVLADERLEERDARFFESFQRTAAFRVHREFEAMDHEHHQKGARA